MRKVEVLDVWRGVGMRKVEVIEVWRGAGKEIGVFETWMSVG